MCEIAVSDISEEPLDQAEGMNPGDGLELREEIDCSCVWRIECVFVLTLFLVLIYFTSIQ